MTHLDRWIEREETIIRRELHRYCAAKRCDKTFKAKRDWHRFCSRACRDAHYREAKRSTRNALHP